ncbi:MAG: putative selenium-dependent hydroxylase accessory protein YqeC [bacterium]|nr:putative selenium-dependent hydroxylase accessory protein YqeC [bacterium]
MDIYELLQIEAGDRLSVIGSGGKTSLLKRLSLGGMSVILTTTTHLAGPRGYGGGTGGAVGDNARGGEAGGVAGDSARVEDYPGVFVPYVSNEQVAAKWRECLEQGEKCMLTGRWDPDKRKITGLTCEEADELSDLDAELVVSEADGSKRLPIKAHAHFEPVLFSKCNYGIAVMGMQALGRRVREGEVHRPELLKKLLGCEEDHALTCQDVARACAAYLAHFKRMKKQALVLSQAEHCTSRDIAELAQEVRKLTHELLIVSQSHAGLVLVDK